MTEEQAHMILGILREMNKNMLDIVRAVNEISEQCGDLDDELWTPTAKEYRDE
jgi:hypothetical protein